ncbi:MAG TPA: hypothetical protein VNI54_12150 [Thermoanaerobaculia bacterium]|nr:hypothetical protein [Thermoanaerobaculia bacterium]
MRHLGILAFFMAAAVAMTWPLAPNLDVAVAHPGDPFINAWILDWEWYALTHGGAALFQGNIFHPLPYTIAFSENLLGILLVLVPLFVAKAPILVIYNVAVLLGYALSGYAMALLGRALTGSTWAGIAAGVFFTFVPWRFSHLTHLQHLWTLWLPLMLLALLRIRDRKTAALFALAFVMNGLTNLHWLAFGSVTIAGALVIVAVSFRAPERARNPLPEAKTFLVRASLAMLIGSLALIPILIPYWKAGRLYGLRGDAGETLEYSGTLHGWTIASLHNRLYGPLTNDGSTNPEHWAFPGVLGIVLALIGIWFATKRERNIALFFIVLGFLGSLGMHTIFGRLLFEYVPLFRGIRAPARWAMIVYLGMAILIAYAAARRRWIAVVLTFALLFELRAAPIRWYLTTGETPPVYRWLATRDVKSVLEVPIAQSNAYEYLYFATVHHKPLVNGVSGFLPPGYDDLGAMMSKAELILVHDDTPIGDPRAVRTPQSPYVLEHPVHWEEITGALDVSGHGDAPLRFATLYFDNRTERIEAAVDGSRFSAHIAERPAGIRADTDLQVEIVDARGTHRLQQVWLRWRRPGEKLQQSQLPQTADLGPYLVHPVHRDEHPRTRPPR